MGSRKMYTSTRIQTYIKLGKTKELTPHHKLVVSLYDLFLIILLPYFQVMSIYVFLQ